MSPCLLALWCLTFVAQEKGQLPTAAEVIANVEANEKLYRTIEVAWGTDYFTDNLAMPMPQMAKWSKRRSHCVLQSNLLRVTSTYEYETLDGKTRRTSELAYAYDGETTRQFLDEIGNIGPGRAPDPPQIFYPHTALFNSYAIDNYPFSLWLRGGAEWRRQARIETIDNVVTVVARENVEGLACLKLKCEYFSTGPGRELLVHRDVWLCPERNYLPVKYDGYTLKDSKDKPLLVAKVTAWNELAPGVWLPHRWTVTANNEAILRKEGRQVRACWGESNILAAKLDPTYEQRFFQTVKFPDNAVVYEKNAQGQIIKKHEPGKHKPQDFLPPEPAALPSSWLFWVLLSLAVVCMSDGTYFIIRRRTAPGQAAA
jgi:hypothetical protein